MSKDKLKGLNGMDSFIEGLMEEWHVPGLAVGIVKDGEVILTRGFGYRDVAGNLIMTDTTTLPIGSATKSFTALALGMLADEGKLDWDKPVKEYIPWFKMYDSFATERMTTRDLLCHRSGLPHHDVHGIFTTKTRKEMVEDLRYLQPSADFRTVLQYQNHMVMTAGYVLEMITGKTWEQFIQERVFNKLGMKNSNFSIKEINKYPEYSKGYAFNGIETIETEFLPLTGMGPAGAINSTAVDMTKYLLLQLGKGNFNGEQLVSEAKLAQMHTAQMIGTPYLWKLDEIEFASYGLCWFVDMYRGHKMVSHGGNTKGFSSLVTLLPEKNFGIIMLSNMDTSFSIYVMTYTILDRILGLEEINWSPKIKTEVDKLFGIMDAMQEKKAKDRIPDTKPSHPLKDYAGEYTHPAFGTIILELDADTLKGKYYSSDLAVQHYHYDIFDVKFTLMGLQSLVTFNTNAQGAIDSLTAPLEPALGVDPIVFKKVCK
ncbi:serine hydrolase [Lutispora sp.]|uniref:serine hydrolase n=1 Tax=Lutispora sp. TaxID=2828727 RepID=UPI002B1FF550|nr:serine hydrolase [Lutispora sp.]MEA4963056.1 serine hydrolase [Lutispora sp.]